MQVLSPQDFPAHLHEIPDKPKKLFVDGALPSPEYKFLAVVGSRKHTNYDKDACEKLIAGLAGYPVVIVSGLALGIDTIAHKAALAAKLKTIAIPGSGLGRQVLYPATNRGLAEEIIKSGGCLLSEYEADFRATDWSFPRRNRIMAGMCDAVLLIEAVEKSGTLITAKLAAEYNRDVYVVPGSIFSETSKGTNLFLRLGATPIRNSEDILEGLGIKPRSAESRLVEIKLEDLSPAEQKLYSLLLNPKSRDDLIRESGLSISEANMALSLMELKNLITESMGEVHKL